VLFFIATLFWDIMAEDTKTNLANDLLSQLGKVLLLGLAEKLPTSRRIKALLFALALLFLTLFLTLLLNTVFDNAELTELTTFSIILAGAGLLLVVALISSFQRALIEPTDHLQQWSDDVRSGKLEVRLNTSEMGELSEVSKDINNLTDYLQSITKNMEDEVKRQTAKFAQKTKSLQVLYDVATSLNTSHDVKGMLTRFLHSMQEIVNAKAGTVRLMNENGKMELVASIGLGQEVLEQERGIAIDSCVCGNAVNDGEVVFQNNTHTCTKMLGRSPAGDDAEMIVVPLQYHGKNLGVYNLFVSHDDVSSNLELKALFSSIGQHLGMAIEKARLDEESKRLSIIKERNALAHELHDSLAQTLASLRFQISMLDDTIDESEQEELKREIHQIKGGLDEAYSELRELLAHFRAPMNAKGLLPALEDLISNFRKQTGMHVLLQKEWDSSTLPANLEMQVLRIIQESLANIRKHSQANTVRVLMRCDINQNYNILIEDDGKGMSRPAFTGHPGEHIGLTIMQERAKLLGGDFKIESESDEGTRVQLSFSLNDIEKRNEQKEKFVLI
jgi:two-component system nitrate/nitrite sensor histidine kinase NarX